MTSRQQLYEWEKQVAEGGSRLDKLKALRLETGKQFFLAKKKRQAVKDLDVRRWALTANQTVDLADFTASPDWVGKFKRYLLLFCLTYDIGKVLFFPDITALSIGRSRSMSPRSPYSKRLKSSKVPKLALRLSDQGSQSMD